MATGPMARQCAASLLLAMVLCGSLGAQSGAVNGPGQAAGAEAGAEEGRALALARTISMQMRAGKVDPGLLDAAMAKGLTPELLAQQKPVFEQLGDLVKLTLDSSKKIGEGTVYKYKADFAMAEVHVYLVLDASGRVAGLSAGTLSGGCFGWWLGTISAAAAVLSRYAQETPGD